jgi:hypothetical protein
MGLLQPPFRRDLRARLKEGRAVAIRYEKTARSFHGVLCLAATADWFKFPQVQISPMVRHHPTDDHEESSTRRA